MINLLYRTYASIWFKNLEISSSELSNDSYVDFEFSDFELEVKGAVYEYQDEQDNSVALEAWSWESSLYIADIKLESFEE